MVSDCVQGVTTAQRVSYLIKAVLNVHTHMGAPLPRTNLPAIFKLIDLIKVEQLSFTHIHTHAYTGY